MSRNDGKDDQKGRISPISIGHMRPRGWDAMPDRSGDGDDGGRGDGNPTIGTFAGDRTGVVRGNSPGDGENAEVKEFVSIREFGRIRAGIAVSRMTSE
jgi:hypothetical protein